jgi:hypothetical protein
VSDSNFDAGAYYRLALAPEDRERLPRYAALVDALSDSPVARTLLGEARAEQRNPMLVLAALHYHALLGDAELAPLYAHVNELEPREFARAVVATLEERPELVRAQLHRATQTNEPGRSAVLAAILHELRSRGVADVHLIDVGTSMGLNLYPDYYNINDAAAAGVNLEIEVLSANMAHGELPRIHERIGIDLHPLDPENVQDVWWLKACLWPEQPERTQRFEQILIAMKQWPAAIRIKGSAVDVIDDALSLCSNDAVPVVFHSWVAAYFSPEDQVRWRERIMHHVRSRALWVYFEHPWSVKGLVPPAPTSDAPRTGATQIVVCERGGEPAHWGWTHPHGRWVALSAP